ncbi:MAG: hypothetical protein ACYCOR_10760 [Acidobacteriaceae bacterium]
MYVWELKGPPDQLAHQAYLHNLDSLIVKSSDGDRWLAQIEQCSEVQKLGMSLGAWAYCYPSNILGQADLIKRALTIADYAVLDVEIEFEVSPNGAKLATQLVDALADYKDRIGFTSFSIPSLHPHFPWVEFSAGVSFAMPQCYWVEQGTTPANSYYRGVTQYAKFDLPIIPVGECQGNATPEQIAQFSALCKNNVGVSFWEWYEATPQQLAAI